MAGANAKKMKPQQGYLESRTCLTRSSRLLWLRPRLYQEQTGDQQNPLNPPLKTSTNSWGAQAQDAALQFSETGADNGGIIICTQITGFPAALG